MMDRFTANYGIGQLNPADTPTYDERDRSTIDGEAPATRNGQQAAD